MVMLKDYRFWLCTIGIVALGLVSGMISGNLGSYYYSLNLPPFSPPSWIFGPMWTVLYILIGISLYLIVTTTSKKLFLKLFTLFIIQFIFNFLWSFIFFNVKNNFLASVDITLLVIFLTMLLYHLWINNRLILWFMIPYYLWVIFASVLTYSIYFLN